MFLEKLKVNRPLTDDEREEQLKQGEKLGVSNNELDDFSSVIKLNSTYLETVDKYYSSKGENTIFFLVFFSLLTFSLGILLFLFGDLWSDSSDIMFNFAIFFIFFIMYPTLTYYLFRALFDESFTYTHCPIRFNRRNQKVYVFTRKGKVISAPWHSIFFTKGRFCINILPVYGWDIRGHIVDDDGETVKQSFELAVLDYGGPELLIKPYWELIRRYMEDDIQIINKTVEYCLPIAESKQGLIFDFKYVYTRALRLYPFYIVMTILLPFVLLQTFGRYLAIRTCKVPVWPEWVEEECQLVPGKLNRTASSNRPWSWRTGWLSQRWSKKEKAILHRIYPDEKNERTNNRTHKKTNKRKK